MIRTLRDTGSAFLIPVDVDGSVYSLISDDCIINKGDNFTMNTSQTSLTVSFEGGSQAIIGGNAFWLTDMVTVQLPANSTIYLCARINPSLPSGSTGSFETLTESQIQKGNVNEGETRDLLMYVITTNGSGVTNVSDRRVYSKWNSRQYDFTITNAEVGEMNYDDILNFDGETDDTKWVQDEATGFYWRIIKVEQAQLTDIKPTWNTIITGLESITSEDYEDQSEANGCITEIEFTDGYVKILCVEDIPTKDVVITVQVA